jgi:uncharacterized membrane protein YozB (DUF420 family)
MDPRLLFWTCALADLGAVCGIALFGVRYAGRGEIARHKRAMKISSLLVVAFLVAYLFKLYFLGREDMSVWTSFDVGILRIHELFVLQMLVGGSVAWNQARKLINTRLVTRDPNDPVPEARTVRVHRLAGRTAVAGSFFAFLFAIGVLIGMYGRAST